MLKVVLLLPKKLLLLQWTTTIANSRWGNALSHPRLHECSFPFPFSQLQPFLLRQQNGLEGLGWGLGDWVLPTPSCFVCRSRALLASSSGYVCCCTINSTATREMHFRSKGAFREMNSLLSRSLFPCKRWALIVRKAKKLHRKYKRFHNSVRFSLFTGWKLDAMTDLHLRQLHTKLNVVQLIFNTKEVYFVRKQQSTANQATKVCKAKSKLPSPTVAPTAAKNPPWDLSRPPICKPRKMASTMAP